MKKIIFLVTVLALLLAACLSPSGGGSPAQSSSEFDINDWDSVLAAAKGQTKVAWEVPGYVPRKLIRNAQP